MSGLRRREALATLLGLPVAGGCSTIGLRPMAARAGRSLTDTARRLHALVPGPVIDAHAHLAPPVWSGQSPQPPRPLTVAQLTAELARNPYIPVPDAAETAAREETRLRAFEAARAAGTMEASADFLVTEMDAAGIDIAINNGMDEINRPFGRPLAVPTERVLADMAMAAARHPGRIVNWFGVDPRRGAEGVALLRRAVRDFGICGMGEWLTHRWKLFPNDRSVAYPYLAACEELGIPYGNNGSGVEPTQAPEVFADILRDFPRLKVVHQAAGLLTDAERAAHPDQVDLPYRLLALAERHANFHLDIDDWQRIDDAGKRRTFAFLRRAFDGPARGRIMFGTDFPVFTRPMSAERFVASLLDDGARLAMPLEARELRMLFSENALRMLDGPLAPPFVRTAVAALR